MFVNHQPFISSWARQSPENFAKVCKFVIFTIRVPLERALIQFNAYENHGDISGLWGWKLQAVQEIEDHATERLARLESLRLGRPADRDAMLMEICKWTGFSVVKGGFVLQLVYGMSGCIDSRNEARLGVDLRSEGLAHIAVTRPKALGRKVRRYHQLIDAAGGTERLWDEWCETIAESRPDVWKDAFEVSYHHALAIKPVTPTRPQIPRPSQGEPDTDIPF